jgi:broad specificity phosphatase PhoE
MTNRIYFARHGQSVANQQRVAAGAQDVLLTEEGIAQAHNEAGDIKRRGLKFDVIIASSLSRAYETARIIARETGYDEGNITTSELLRERNLGSYEGASLTEFSQSSESEKEAAGAERLVDLAERIKRADKFIKQHASGVTLVVGHDGFYRMARCVAEGLDPSMTYSLDSPRNSVLVEYPL